MRDSSGHRWTAKRGPSLAALAFALSSCTAAHYAADADREVLPLLSARTDEVLGTRADTVLYPAPLAADDSLAADGELPDEPGPTLALDLATSLATAVTTGRQFLFQKESLYLTGLGLTLQRFNFGPLLNGTIDYLYSKTEGDGFGSAAAFGGTFGISKILDSGGLASFTTTAGRSATGNDGLPPSYASAASISIAQPLLRGAGYEVSHEALTQSERGLIYAIRDFELFREDFSIDIAADYFDLVSQKKQLVNLRRDFEQSQFDRQKALALRQVDRNEDEDVFLAQRREIAAENSLLDAETRFERDADDFKIRLGLPASTPIKIVDAEPEFVPIRLDADSAVAVALANRLDLQTAAEQLEDSERAVRIARNALLPDANLTLGLGGTSFTTDSGNILPDENDTVTAGLSIDLPLRRKAERNSYRSTLIALDRDRRDYDELLDVTDRVIRDQLRELTQLETQIGLQELQIEQENRAVAISEFRYEAGELDGRDLLDARQALITARNDLIDLVTSHFILRLRLLRNLGILFIDDNGMWTS